MAARHMGRNNGKAKSTGRKITRGYTKAKGVGVKRKPVVYTSDARRGAVIKL